MLSRKRQERKMMMKTAKTLGFAGSVPAVLDLRGLSPQCSGYGKRSWDMV